MNYDYTHKSTEFNKSSLIDNQNVTDKAKISKQDNDSKIPLLNNLITKNQTFKTEKSLSDVKSDVGSKLDKSSESQSIFNKNFPKNKETESKLSQKNGVEKDNFLIKQTANMQKEREEIEKKIESISKKIDEAVENDAPMEVLEKLGEKLDKEESKLSKLKNDLLLLDKEILDKERSIYEKKSTEVESIQINSHSVDQTQVKMEKLIENLRTCTLNDGKLEATFVKETDFKNRKISDLVSFNAETGEIKVTKKREEEFRGMIGTTMRVEVAPQTFREVTVISVETFKKKELAEISRSLMIYQNPDNKLEEDAKKNKNIQANTTYQPNVKAEAEGIHQNKKTENQSASASVDTKLKFREGEKESPVKQLQKYFEAALKKYDKEQQSVEKHEQFIENKKTDYEIHEQRIALKNESDLRIYTLLKEINHKQVVLPPEISTRLRVLSTRLVQLDSLPKDTPESSKELASLKKEMVQLLEETTTISGKMEASSRSSEGKPTSPG